MTHHPAAFINAIAEEGTKDEAIKHLQETWNELMVLKQENDRIIGAAMALILQAVPHEGNTLVQNRHVKALADSLKAKS